MADQCIICLDDLPTFSLEQSNDNPTSEVAKIKSCGHILHDDCLTAWTQKANSCPICRATFNLVEVYDQIGGSLLSERTVEDKKQIAEFDPQPWVEEEQLDEIETPPCPICGDNDNEDVLLLCDGCDAPYHTHCVGLDRVPSGNWFCMECVDQGASVISNFQSSHRLNSQRQPRTSAQRTQAQVRRARHRHVPDAWSGAWNQISSRVWDNLNLDLEYGDEDNALTQFRDLQRRTDRQRRDFRAWQQRLAIASRQGARRQFADAVRPHLQPLQRQVARQEISKEEEHAWNAFDSILQTDEAETVPRKRRRSPDTTTAGPSESPAEPERKLKRPKTRRIPNRPHITVQTGSPSGYMSPSTGTAPSPKHSSARSTSPVQSDSVGAPSFLSTLLREVEMSVPHDDEGAILPYPAAATSPPDQSSVGGSPVVSAYSSPRAMSATPPPLSPDLQRPSSPPLSSRVEPSYLASAFVAKQQPTRQAFSASSGEPSTSNRQSGTPNESQQPNPLDVNGNDVRERRVNEASPSRGSSLPTSAKEDISKFVRTALNPYYKKESGGISKEQYALVNRSVSHILYEMVRDIDILQDESKKGHWEKLASDEVARAVEALEP